MGAFVILGCKRESAGGERGWGSWRGQGEGMAGEVIKRLVVMGVGEGLVKPKAWELVCRTSRRSGARAQTKFWRTRSRPRYGRTSPNRILAHEVQTQIRAHEPKPNSGARAQTKFWRTSSAQILAHKLSTNSGAQAHHKFWHTSSAQLLAHELITLWCEISRTRALTLGA